ncbi:helix-turn-helix domain-containing protein, partial [Cylindrospermopsis raciborskii]
MLKLDRVLNQERLLRAMTGLNRQAFNELLSQFADTYERTVFNSLANRKRSPGGGRKPTLRSIEEKLFYILLYCKCYPTFDLLSVLFNFDRSCAHDWVHRLLSVLETT